MNVVNFSDGIDGLAAGVCAISAIAFAIIAFDLGKDDAGILAAITAGAALGFLVHNFHPASVFMGDCGSNLLGLLLGAIIVEGSLKTNALIALIGPLVVLAVPFLDTGFVVAKRIKYRRPIYHADSNHFHHRFHRIGFSQRRTVLYLYGWTITMAGLAVALRFVPYSDAGDWHLGWSLFMVGCFLVALAASVYLVLVLEILKLRRLRAWQMRHADPETAEHEIDERVERELETGEFGALERSIDAPSAACQHARMAHLLDLTTQGDVGTLADPAKLASVTLMTPQQLYELWERRPWSAHAIDLERDKADWAALDPPSCGATSPGRSPRSSSGRSG